MAHSEPQACAFGCYQPLVEARWRGILLLELCIDVNFIPFLSVYDRSFFFLASLNVHELWKSKKKILGYWDNIFFPAAIAVLKLTWNFTFVVGLETAEGWDLGLVRLWLKTVTNWLTSFTNHFNVVFLGECIYTWCISSSYLEKVKEWFCLDFFLSRFLC